MDNLSKRFTKAFDYARIAHGQQYRSWGQIPYVYHPLAVASLVLEYKGTEDQAIAALLHRTLHECGASHERIIRRKFGTVVADIVVACTASSAEDKALNTHASSEVIQADWIARKRYFIRHLANVSHSTAFVSTCDHLHTAQTLVVDMQGSHRGGKHVLIRFNGGPEATLDYYHTLADEFYGRGSEIGCEFRRVVKQMHALAGVEFQSKWENNGAEPRFSLFEPE